ncbi:unnamed protein product [Mytilus coruscus]|uniref:Uncharacterized protein n=1 Tax=Mytilus coruscus TaxID=42192 RepID=A0A6J8ABS7_MYTCO|nr:unnamed protein product [Mytilus coruscus]
MINDGLKPITAKVDKLSCNFENDIKLLKNTLRNKDNEIINLQTQISEYKQRITLLQADVKLKTQELKELDDELDRGKVQKKITDKIASRLDALDNRLKSQTVQKKTLYRDVAAEDQTVEPRNIPVIDTRTSRGSINTDKMDFPSNVHSSSRHNYIDFMTLNNDTNTHSADTDYQQARPIKPLVSENDMSVFRGVVRRRTKRIVLYNVLADRPYELVNNAVKLYAEQKGVHVTFTKYAEQKGAHVTFTKLLKRRENRGSTTFIMRVNMNEDDYKDKIENTENFWPNGVYCRDYIPYNNHQSES